jgi:hypothetical protein
LRPPSRKFNLAPVFEQTLRTAGGLRSHPAQPAAMGDADVFQD